MMTKRLKSATGWLCLLLFAGPSHADEILWRSGPNLYIKLAKQDESKREATPLNQHPARLNANQIANALEGIEVWGAGGMFKRKRLKRLFSLQQARLLGQYLSAGLSKARPDQDLIFVLARSEKKYYIIQNTGYTGGRAFYLDDKLHVIIGDYDATGDRFKETAYRSHGVTDLKQHFKHGRRAKPSNFKASVVGRAGVRSYEEGGRPRRDWLVVDLEQAATDYLAEKAQQAPTELVADAALQEEAARLAQERRQMRLEMARMRKEMKGAGAEQQTPEQRLATLKSLRDKELITDEEYQQKRQRILGEL